MPRSFRSGIPSWTIIPGALAALALAAALVIGLSGGGTLDLGLLRLSLRDPLRAVLAGMLAAAVFVIARSRAQLPANRSAAAFESALSLAFWTLCLAIAGTWCAYKSTTSGGLDSYAYVSTAQAFGEGRLRVPEPLGPSLPFDFARSAASPPGWIPAPDGRTIQPEFPPGLPLVMALFLRATGPGGPYWVSPFFAVVAVLAVYGIAARTGGTHVARLASVATAAHPVFVTQAIQPMSDVIATAWLLIAVLCLVLEKPRPVLAGCFAVLAIWTRPPLMLPVAGASLLLISANVAAGASGGFAGSPAGSRRSAWLRYTLVTAAGVFCLALFQWYLYGNPLVSGRGSASSLFRPEHVLPNTLNYAASFTYINTPLVYVGLVLGLWRRSVTSERWIFVLLFFLTGIPYLAYLEFADWEALRYWLPALPLILVIASAGLVSAIDRILPRRTALVVVVTAWCLAGASLLFLRTTPVFDLWQSEQRFRLVGDLVALHTSPRDVVLADVHSGSIRMYGRRATMRYQAIPSDRLEETIAALADAGRRTVVVLDDWVEEGMFRKQFAGVLDRLEVTSEWHVRGISVLSLGIPRSQASGGKPPS